MTDRLDELAEAATVRRGWVEDLRHGRMYAVDVELRDGTPFGVKAPTEEMAVRAVLYWYRAFLEDRRGE